MYCNIKNNQLTFAYYNVFLYELYFTQNVKNIYYTQNVKI